jgi:hypothetical protein
MIDAEHFLVKLKMFIPAASLSAAIVTPDLGPPLNFTACWENIGELPDPDNCDGQEDVDVTLDWDAPAVGTPTQYRIEYFLQNGVMTEWQYLDDISHPLTTTTDLAATEITDDCEYIPIQYRIRAESATDESEWVYATAYLC